MVEPDQGAKSKAGEEPAPRARRTFDLTGSTVPPADSGVSAIGEAWWSADGASGGLFDHCDVGRPKDDISR